jgi:hypothetical protein|tara:strand:+ start:239 stop:502 length:264 start_codon:yes stop_codon:yes gene_type:complete
VIGFVSANHYRTIAALALTDKCHRKIKALLSINMFELNSPVKSMECLKMMLWNQLMFSMNDAESADIARLFKLVLCDGDAVTTSFMM